MRASEYEIFHSFCPFDCCIEQGKQNFVLGVVAYDYICVSLHWAKEHCEVEIVNGFDVRHAICLSVIPIMSCNANGIHLANQNRYQNGLHK